MFEVHAGSWAGAAVHSDTLTVTSGTVAELAEGTYAWGVQGLNSTSTTQFAHRILTIDRTAPVAPVLLTPANNAALGDSLVQFTWTPGSDALGGAIDSMFLYTTGTQAPMRRIATNTGSHAEVLDTGTYSWLVRCHDGAGNSSATPLRSFTVQ